jgi:allantoinase
VRGSDELSAGRAHELIVRGLLVAGDRAEPGELGIADGRIEAIAGPRILRGERLLDAGERLLLPGAVDVHVHTGSEPGEGMGHATRAAARGGVTTIVDMPFDAHGPLTDPPAFDRKRAAIDEDAVVDVAVYGTVPAGGDRTGLDELVRAGITAVKLSTQETHPVRFPRSSAYTILRTLEQLAGPGVVTAFHCENEEILAGVAAAAPNADHGTLRPPVAEHMAIAAVIELAAATGAPVHFAHVTTARGVEMVARARSAGVDVSAETCPHYLLLDSADGRRLAGRGKVNPPLRERAEVEGLWRALSDGTLGIVASDHVGWPGARKDTATVADAAAGIPGLETMLPLLFSEGVVRRGLPLARVSAVLAENPARRFGLWPRKGSLAVGSDADVAILDPGARWRIQESELTTNAGWSPYAGREVSGRVTDVLLRGIAVLQDGALVDRSPGRLIARARSSGG